MESLTAGRQFITGAQSSGEDIHVESSIVPGTNIIRTVYEIRKSDIPKYLFKIDYRVIFAQTQESVNDPKVESILIMSLSRDL